MNKMVSCDFKNQREVVAHLAGGGKIKNIDDVMYMDDRGDVYVEDKDGDRRTDLDNYAHAWSKRYENV